MVLTEQQKYIGNTALGVTGGAAAYAWCPRFVNKQYAKLFNKYCDNFSSQEQKDIWQAAQKALADSSIKDKVTLIDYNTTNWEPIADEIVKKRREHINRIKGPISKLLSKLRLNDEEFKEHFYTIAQGKNACFVPSTSQVLVNKEKKANTAFHELGHALNANSSENIVKKLARSRNKYLGLIPLIFGTSMLIPKDREDKPTQHPIYQALLFFKKISGLLVSACFLPIVTEEGLASLRGAELAKKLLSPELCSKVNKANGIAFGSYALAMILAGAATTFANYLKDKVTGPLPPKN